MKTVSSKEHELIIFSSWSFDVREFAWWLPRTSQGELSNAINGINSDLAWKIAFAIQNEGQALCFVGTKCECEGIVVGLKTELPDLRYEIKRF